MRDFRPMGGRVLVERLKTTDIVGGIYIPESAKERANVGKVLAVGPGKLQPIGPGVGRYVSEVKEGDRILFGKYSGVDFEDEGKTLLVLREEEILGILVDNVSVV